MTIISKEASVKGGCDFDQHPESKDKCLIIS